MDLTKFNTSTGTLDMSKTLQGCRFIFFEDSK